MTITPSVIPKYIYYSAAIPDEFVNDVLASDGVELRHFTEEQWDPKEGGLLIYLLDKEFIDTNRARLDSYFEHHNSAIFSVLLHTESAHTISSDIAWVDDILVQPIAPALLRKKIKNVFAYLHYRYENQYLQTEIDIMRNELDEMSSIGALLMVERDLDRLLEKILANSIQFTNADAGSIYLVEENEMKERYLRFKLSQNNSVSFDSEEFTFPVTKESIAGYAVVTGEPVNIADTYDMPAESPFQINRSIDEKIGYCTKSMLTMPLKNRADDVIGVLQLINKKRDGVGQLATPEDCKTHVIPFDSKSVSLINSLGGGAAVSIENSLLYESIEKLFEGFVKASVTAIESRDPTTSGHSSRVAMLTVKLAETVDRMNSGKFRAAKFSKEQLKEIRYASLLHDFGKVGVREHVLLKEKKLYSANLINLMHRIRFIQKDFENQMLKEKLTIFLQNGNAGHEPMFQELDRQFEQQIAELNEYLLTIETVNEPTVLEQQWADKVQNLARLKFIDFDGEEKPILDNYEVAALSIPKGSLDEEERLEIESHVTHTYRFLQQVPWTSELKHIPEIAYAHHEKLKGDGYPRQLRTTEIPLQSKMMTISDIYDALTAADRPYKKAVPSERALSILELEVKDDHVDPDLLRAFIEAEVYAIVHV